MTLKYIDDTDQNSAIKSLLDLFIQKEEKQLEIADMLGEIARYFQAECAYIYEREKDSDYCFCSEVWCEKNCRFGKERFQRLQMPKENSWMESEYRAGRFYFQSKNQELRENATDASCLYHRDITGFMIAPFDAGNELYGFMGLDNPKRNLENTLFLTIAASMLNKELILRSEKRKSAFRESLIYSLSHAYFCIYHINLEKNSFIEISENKIKEVEEHIGEKGNAREKFLEMGEFLVAPEHKEEMLEFTNLDSVREKLKTQDVIGNRFLGVHVGWCEGMFVSVKRDAEGNCLEALWCVKSIQKEKEKDLVHQEEMLQALESARKANAAKTVFLNNMSHDIRTPMNAIMGFAALMEKNMDSPTLLAEYLQKIQSSGEYLMTIINNVLDMAKIDSGEMYLDEVATDIKQELRDMRTIFDNEVKEKKIHFTYDVKAKHNWIYCDVLKFKQIGLNIISNAIKYTPEGGDIAVYLREYPGEKEEDLIYEFVCKDNGIGISKEFLPHIFDSFSRERNTTESKIMGTGLGMPIVKKLVELMGGTVEIKSELGKGTSFKITLPFRIAETPEEQVNNSMIHQEIDIELKGKRILLAEDNDLNAEIAMEILKEEGMEVEWARDGIICVDMLMKAEAGYYDMILMDIQMPNMDGCKATTTIREMKTPKRKDIPIIAMTANAFEEDKRKAFAAGMNGFLAKPIRIKEFREILKHELTN